MAVIDTGMQAQLVAMLGSQSAAEQVQACKALQSSEAMQRHAAGSHADEPVCTGSAVIAPLVELLQSPSADVQAAAAAALAAQAEGDPHAQYEVVEAGALPLLAALLGAPSPGAQQQACWALRALAQSQIWTMPAGIVEALVGLLQQPSAPVRGAAVPALAEVAAACMCSPAASEAQSTAISALPLLVAALDLQSAAVQQQARKPLLGAIAAITKREGDVETSWGDWASAEFVLHMARSQDAQLQERAADALAILTGCFPRFNQREMLAAGALPLLLQLLRSPLPALQGHAAEALGRLAWFSEEPEYHALMSAGTAKALVGLLRSAASDKVRGSAADALGSIAGRRRTSGGLAAVVAAGAVPPLLDLLGSRSSEAARSAARAVQAIAAGNAACQAGLLAAGAVERLAPLLGSAAEQGDAAAALAALAADNAHGKSAVAASGAFEVLARQLRAPANAAETAYALSTLAAGNAEGQARAVAAGAVEALVPLLDISLLEPSVCFQWDHVPDQAARALGIIAAGCAEGQDAAVALGAVPLLVRLLAIKEASAGGQLHSCTAAALAAVAGGAEAAQLRPAVPLLVGMLGDRNASVEEQACRALEATARRCSVLAAELRAAVKPLVDLLQPAAPDNIWSQHEPGVLATAAGALCAVAGSSAGSRAEAVATGAAPCLVELLQSLSPPVQEQACMAILALVDGNLAGEQALVGAVVPLLGLLREPSANVQRAAAEALGVVAACADAHAEVVPCGTGAALKHLLAAHPARLHRHSSGSPAAAAASGDDSHAEAAAAELQLLVKLLDSASAAVQQQACAALRRLTESGASCGLDIAAAIAPLVALLHSPSPEVQSAAAAALAAVASPDSAMSEPALVAELVQTSIAAFRTAAKHADGEFAAAAATSPLMQMLWQQACTKEEAAAAAGALGVLAVMYADGQAAAMSAVPQLVGWLDAESPATQEQACRALRRIAAGSAKGRGELLAEGAAQPLVRLLHDGQSAVVQAEAAAVLGAMAVQCREAQDEAVAAGAVPALVGLLQSASAAPVQAQALLALGIVAQGSAECREQLMQAGVVAVLQPLQAAESVIVRELGRHLLTLLE